MGLDAGPGEVAALASFFGCSEPAFDALGEASGVAVVMRGFVSQNGLLFMFSLRPLPGVCCAGELACASAGEAASGAALAAVAAIAPERGSE